MFDLAPFFTPDVRDLVYLTLGLSFFVLTLQPAVRHLPFIAAPPLFLAAGFLIATWPAAGLLPDLVEREAFVISRTVVIEHVTELIVIVSLAGAGLAIDTGPGWRSWLPVWRHLVVTMPLTILALVALGVTSLGLSLAAAVLLAAALAPTDPVLARSVQVKGPGDGGEGPVRLGLTGEAGFNDGLAFPFVYLAIALAGLDAASAGDGGSAWFRDWFAIDFAYRVLAAVAIGWILGQVASRVIFSSWGDGGETRERGENAGLTMMAGTFVSYGLAELFSGYGFLAVFVAAVSVRSYARGHDTHDPYVRHPHRFGDQFESLLLAVLLLWLGASLATGTMAGWTWAEAGVAVLLVLGIRPAAGWIAMAGFAGQGGTALSRRQRAALAFYGVRGLGTVFYIAYGINHADFAQAEADAVWRVAAIAITLSIVVHGISAGVAMRRVAR